MNYDALHITCCFFGLDLYRFDEWLEQLPDGEFRRAMAQSRARVIEVIEGWDGPTKIDLQDDESQTLVKLHILEMRQQWRGYKRDAVTMPLVRKEQTRIRNLPTAEEKHQRWKEIAAEIRQAKPYIKSTLGIARLVRHRLVNSHDDRDTKFTGSIERIRKVI